ncbi:MAG: cellulase family glycosylhydrolase [Anaerolineae bacterium]|nr:cellulase family glycosylhydrolase [Anaerolineae bacterium]
MHTDGIWFKDEAGRALILRGVNLGGSTKVPYTPDGATHRREGFYDHRTVSFIGRPFPLDEADSHLRRLKAWGMNFLRFLITWEAVEHGGPGIYDEAYLDYLYAVVHKAGEYGLDVFIDPHQDVWSRWTGGDGAPGWTLEAVGMDLTKLAATGTAINHPEHGDPFPRMIWPTNYFKLGAGTMFTLFFGGNDFAPQTLVDGVPVQEFLQGHYIAAIRKVAERLHGLPNVVGYDTLNEPGSGFIGVQDAGSIDDFRLRMGPMPTPFQSMLLGSGYSQSVDVHKLDYSGIGVTGFTTLNPAGESLWRGECLWKQNGVWTDEGGQPRLLRPDHFAQVNGRPVDFGRDYLKPFMLRFIRAIREVEPAALVFMEGDPNGGHAAWSADDPAGVVNAGHWYDGMTLLTKTFNPEFSVDFQTMKVVESKADVQALFDGNLAHLKQVSSEQMNHVPTLLGEFGVPFDLDDKAAYSSGDFSLQTQALDMYYHAMDANLLNCTLWNYTADNTHAYGDQWNGEDLSIFCRDQHTNPDDIHSGGRGLEAVVRPYALRTAGEPLRMQFDRATRTFEFEFRHDPQVTAPTEIFVPNYQYPSGCTVELSDGTSQLDEAAQVLTVHHTPDRATHHITIRPARS